MFQIYYEFKKSENKKKDETWLIKEHQIKMKLQVIYSYNELIIV